MPYFLIKRRIQQELNLSHNDLSIIDDQIQAVITGWQYKITSINGYRYNFENANRYIPKHEVDMMTHQGWVEIVQNNNSLVLEMEYAVNYSNQVFMFVWMGIIGIIINYFAYWAVGFMVIYSFFTFYMIRKKCRQMLLQISQV